MPVYAPQMARNQVPATWQARPPQPAAPPAAMPVSAALAGGATPRPTVRAQAPDVPARQASPLMLPTPEALGLAPGKLTLPAPTEVDWNEVRTRLRRLNAVAFHLDHVAAGQWRATLLVPQAGQPARQVEASAGSDAAAVADVLQQAEVSLDRR